MQIVELLFIVEIFKFYCLFFGLIFGYWFVIFQFLKLVKFVENDWQEWCDENNVRKRVCFVNDFVSCQRNERGSERFEYLIIDNVLWVISFFEDDLVFFFLMICKNCCIVNDEILKQGCL